NSFTTFLLKTSLKVWGGNGFLECFLSVDIIASIIVNFFQDETEHKKTEANRFGFFMMINCLRSVL
ncbi:hypothetical protein, partial [Flavobacterium branchiicola]